MPLKYIIYKIKNSKNNISLTQCFLIDKDEGPPFSMSFDLSLRNHLTPSCIILKNGQTYLKNLALCAPRDF